MRLTKQPAARPTAGRGVHMFELPMTMTMAFSLYVPLNCFVFGFSLAWLFPLWWSLFFLYFFVVFLHNTATKLTVKWPLGLPFRLLAKANIWFGLKVFRAFHLSPCVSPSVFYDWFNQQTLTRVRKSAVRCPSSRVFPSIFPLHLGWIFVDSGFDSGSPVVGRTRQN